MNHLANEMSLVGWRSLPTGGLGACPQQVKKGRSPLLRRSFFKELGTKLHTCTKKHNQKYKQTNTKEKGQKMKQTTKINKTKLKIITLLTITTIITGCATNTRHKKIALKLIKNNNVILNEIKNERSKHEFKQLTNKSPELIESEKRLMMAINAVINSNETVKDEFKTNKNKEVRNERRQFKHRTR